MADTSTFNQLLAYAYNETGLLESDRIQRTIDGDPLIGQEYKEIVNLVQTLDAATPVVSEKCVEQLLNKIKEL